MTDQGSLIQLGSPIPGFLVSSAPGTPPDKVRAEITKIHGILGHPPVAWPCGVIPVAPVAKEKSDPNRILRGRLSGNVPMIPLPIFTWIHTGKWAIGLPRSGPAPAAPVPDGMDPAPVDSRPSL